MPETGPERSPTDRARYAETVLKRLGYARVRPERRQLVDPEVSFWVQEPGFPRRTAPVFLPPSETTALAERIDRWLGVRGPSAARRAIFVAPSDSVAEEAWSRLSRQEADVGSAVSILVVPRDEGSEATGHFHLRRVSPGELLRIATGVVVGLFRRAQAAEMNGQIDFEEMLGILRGQFGVDVRRSLGVESDEDSLFLLYQLAQRDAYAPGEGGANVHLLVLKPTGPAARLPWFAG